jgi:CYTH domain-containing protein
MQQDARVEHPDAPVGKALKYALVERERRFLLGRVPTGACVRRAVITDRYLSGTRLRLRQTIEMTVDGTVTLRKLTQKIPAPAGGPGLITTLYVDEAEHAALRALPGAELVKTRYSVPPFGVDVFTGPLTGLVVAEVEFATDDEHDRFPAPPESRAEVTLDPRLTGGRLVRMDRSELLGILTAYALEPVDASELATRPLAPNQG